jgi:hypothetical protein
VTDDVPVQADLAVPGAERVRSAICGAPEIRASVVRSGSGSGAVVAGVVRHASGGGPVAGATVSAEWMEVTIQRGLSGRIRRLTARTADDGWFAFCDVPRAGAVGMLAAHGADSTGAVELQAPPSGYVHRVLYVGGVATDTAAGAPRLRGTVVAAAAPGRPLGGALVRVPGGPETRTDDRGEWVLAGAPPGTRTIEVRAVGYYPQRRVVDVTAGSPPVRVALSRFEAVLDTIRVTAAPADRDQIDFLRRARSGAGRYLTPADIARRRPIVTTDLFRNLSGLRLEGYGQSARLSMRGGMSAFGGGGDDRCAPHVYLNGVHFEAGPDDLDTWITPRRIKGIEVYPDATVPVQFRPPMQTCGSIVIWMH